MISLQALQKTDDGYAATFRRDDGSIEACLFTVTEVRGIDVASLEPDLLFPHSGLAAEDVRRITAALIAFARSAD